MRYFHILAISKVLALLMLDCFGLVLRHIKHDIFSLFVYIK